MLTRKVFNDLAIFMVGFGVLIGIIFPFFVLLMGVPRESVLQPTFILACILAGVFVGGFNIFLARQVVGRRLKIMTTKMLLAEGMVGMRMVDADAPPCNEKDCHIPVDSDDVLGDAAKAFNALVQSLSLSYRTEARVKAFTQVISSRLELEGLCTTALDVLIEHSGAIGGALITEQSGILALSAVRGIEHPEGLLENPLLWQVLKRQSPHHVELPADVHVNALLVTYTPKALLFLPVSYKDVPVGVVILATLDAFDAQTRAHLDLFTGSLALALRNAITHNQLQKLAANDPLTNIFNRRFGMLRLQEEYSRAVRLEQPLGLIMGDLDHFKAVNDTYGHLVGDRLLVQVSSLAKQALREGDIFIRYGGEEFLAVLPGASLNDARTIAERFRRLVEENTLQHGDQIIKTTISFGVSALPDSEITNMTTLIDKADKALYHAKELGRNKVV
ncbi:MAG: GGDEF domain-containing protein [Acholeplasmatales bacterium]|nr:MAG: GGDEF domain-containing protein [Acholeplasmatales bacterium]